MIHWSSAVPAGTQEHKSLVCAAMYAELAYLMEGAQAEDRLKKLKKDGGPWRDPACDVLDCEDTSCVVSACEQVCTCLPSAQRMQRLVGLCGVRMSIGTCSTAIVRCIYHMIPQDPAPPSRQ